MKRVAEADIGHLEGFGLVTPQKFPPLRTDIAGSNHSSGRIRLQAENSMCG